jgi:hypothetical protein
MLSRLPSDPATQRQDAAWLLGFDESGSVKSRGLADWNGHGFAQSVSARAVGT